MTEALDVDPAVVNGAADAGHPDAHLPAAGHPDADHPVEADASRLTEPARVVVLTEVTQDPLDVNAHAAAVAGISSGAVVTFAGVVRNHDHGRSVAALEYVGHPTAGDVLARVVRDVVAASDLEAASVAHRLGPLEIGDAALVVAVAGAHRAEAFATCSRLVDEVKRQLPVWKRQVFADGTDEWVDCP